MEPLALSDAEKGVILAVGFTAASLGAAETLEANSPAQELTGAAAGTGSGAGTEAGMEAGAGAMTGDESGVGAGALTAV